MKKFKLALLLSFIGCALAGSAIAASTAASSMHYGVKQTTNGQFKAKGTGPIVITNCTEQEDNVSAWFTDGSSKTMPIYPSSDYPMNVISIGDSYPYVTIQITTMGGAVIFPAQPIYPGQDVNIGCNATVKASKKIALTVR